MEIQYGCVNVALGIVPQSPNFPTWNFTVPVKPFFFFFFNNLALNMTDEHLNFR